MTELVRIWRSTGKSLELIRPTSSPPHPLAWGESWAISIVYSTITRPDTGNCNAAAIKGTMRDYSFLSYPSGTSHHRLLVMKCTHIRLMLLVSLVSWHKALNRGQMGRAHCASTVFVTGPAAATPSDCFTISKVC